MTEISLTVGGMSCGGCVTNVRGVLSALTGVSKVTVFLEENRADVVYDPERISPQALCEAIENAGFEAQPA
jgi:copper chaperone